MVAIDDNNLMMVIMINEFDDVDDADGTINDNNGIVLMALMTCMDDSDSILKVSNRMG